MHPRLRWVSVLFGGLVALVIACGSGGGGSPATPGDGGPTPADGAADAKTPVTLEGDLHFAGCTPAPADVRVKLRGVTGITLPGEDLPRLPARVETADVTATADPHVLHWKKEGLPQGDVFQLGAVVSEASCGTVAWKGPEHGLLVAGAPSTRIDAAAVKSHVEIHTTRATGTEWVRADMVPSSQLTSLQLRVVNDVKDAVEYELQISYDRFPITLDAGGACATPTAAPVTKRRFPVQAGAAFTTMPLDLMPTAYVPGGLTLPPRELVRRQMVQQGAPIYVRAVPILAGGAACDPEQTGIFGSALISVVPDLTLPAQFATSSIVVTGGSYTPPSGPDPRPLANTDVCYRAVKDYTPPEGQDALFDPIGSTARAIGAAIAYKPGQFFCLSLSSDDTWAETVFEGFEDFVGTVVSGVEWAVNSVAKLYAEIKTKAVDIAVDAIQATTNLKCEGMCREALTAGLEAGMCAMGLPPSLPDFDELVDKGLDYVAAEIARTTGVPAELTGRVLELAENAIAAAKHRRGSGTLDWAVPDSGYHPAVLVFSLSRGTPNLTPPQRLVFDSKGSTGSAYLDTPFPGNGADAVDVPIALQPNVNGLPAVPPITFYVDPVTGTAIPLYGTAQHGEAWFQQKSNERLAGACLPFRLFGGGGYPVVTIAEKEAEIALPNAATTFSGNKEQQCTP